MELQKRFDWFLFITNRRTDDVTIINFLLLYHLYKEERKCRKENVGKKIQGDENCVGCKRKGKRIFRKTKISSIKERDTISGLGKKNLY